MIPVPANSMQTCERGFSNQRVSGQTLKRHRHPNTEICANHDAISKRSRVWATLELVGCRDNNINYSRKKSTRQKRFVNLVLQCATHDYEPQYELQLQLWTVSWLKKLKSSKINIYSKSIQDTANHTTIRSSKENYSQLVLLVNCIHFRLHVNSVIWVS